MSEYFDIVDDNGIPTGEIVSRDDAHKYGIQHRTAHVWIIKGKPDGYDILLQKRSRDKDSFPGQYDTSSAGHIPAGDESLESALRELKEELGIEAGQDDLHYAGSFHIHYEKEFHGSMFRDNEIARVYVYEKPVEIEKLSLQGSEVEEVRWFDLDEVWNEIHNNRERICVPTGGLYVLREYLRLVGLKKDGTVVSAGRNKYNFSNWPHEIIKIIAQHDDVFGISRDGRIFHSGRSSVDDILKHWRGIVSIFATGSHGLVALTCKGTVIYHEHRYGAATSNWKDIIWISADTNYIIGVDIYGQLHYSGNDEHDLARQIANWKLFEHIDNVDEDRKLLLDSADEVRKSEIRTRQKEIQEIIKNHEAEIDKLKIELSNFKYKFLKSKKQEIESLIRGYEKTIVKLKNEMKELEET